MKHPFSILRSRLFALFAAVLILASIDATAQDAKPALSAGDLPGEWRTRSRDAVQIDGDPDGASVSLTGRFQWKGRYDRETGVLELTAHPTAEQIATRSAEAPAWARKRVSGQLEWRVALRTRTDYTNGCRLILEGDWLPGVIEWTEVKDKATGQILLDKSTAVAKEGGVPERVEYSRERRFDLPPVGNWLRPIWAPGRENEAAAKLGYACAGRAISNIAGDFLEKGALTDFLGLYKAIFKSLLVGKALVGIGGADPSFPSTFYEKFILNLSLQGIFDWFKTRILGQDSIGPGSYFQALGATLLGAAIGGQLPASPFFENISDRLGIELANWARQKADQKLEDVLSWNGRFRVKSGGFAHMHSTAIVDTCTGNVQFMIYLQQTTECPWAVVSCSGGGLPLEGRAQRSPRNTALHCEVVATRGAELKPPAIQSGSQPQPAADRICHARCGELGTKWRERLEPAARLSENNVLAYTRPLERKRAELDNVVALLTRRQQVAADLQKQIEALTPRLRAPDLSDAERTKIVEKLGDLARKRQGALTAAADAERQLPELKRAVADLQRRADTAVERARADRAAATAAMDAYYGCLEQCYQAAIIAGEVKTMPEEIRRWRDSKSRR